MNKKSGFTIVELLVVIVVIGILASITIVSYTGISNKAIVASLQSDLASASKQIKLFQATSPTNDYPTANNCPTPGATEICIKTSGSNALISNNGYTVNNSASPKYFSIIANNGSNSYRVTENSAPITYSSLATTDPANWIAIGSQTWARANLNVGTRINGSVNQTNNGGSNVIEKWCFNDLDANCTTYGGLYLWDEAMQYVTTEGVQGICPAGSHIPTHNEIKILEMYLGLSQSQADAFGIRGSNQGTQLKSGGSSGMNILQAGSASLGFFNNLGTTAYIWSSSQLDVNSAYGRYIATIFAGISMSSYTKTGAFSIRCIGN